MAHADNVTNSVGASGTTTVTLLGASVQTTVSYTLNAQGHTCLASPDHHAIYNVRIGAPAGVTASPSVVDFAGCANPITVTFTATSAGSRLVQLVQDASSPVTVTAGPAAFTLAVNGSANTAPQVSVGGVSDGATYELGSVPTPTCSVVDAEDGTRSPAPTLSAITGSLASYGLGTRTATCSYTDSGGSSQSASATYSIIDTTKPELRVPGDQTIEATGTVGAEATWDDPTATDAAGIGTGPSCDIASPHTFNLGAHQIHCSVTDVAGNTSTGSFTVTVTDTTKPSLSVSHDVTAEATGPGGARVTYDPATSTDLHDGVLSPTCAPVSGSTFSLGSTDVTCSVTDSSGNTAAGGFTVTVHDTTAPSLTLPDDITAEATRPDGADVEFAATADDLVDGSTPVTCDHHSGDGFGFGTTMVSCSSTDAQGNLATRTFHVTIQDTTPPAIAHHDTVTREATGPHGAVVDYAKPSATDAASTHVQVDCIPDTGSQFALGSTPVNCTATDEHGLTSATSFDVVVQDTTGPAVTVPDNKTVEATGPSGAAATFDATASDLVDGPTAASCDPASGSTFALDQTTTVTCTSTDAHGNTGTNTFNVTVQDTTAPTITIPAGRTAEATGPDGAAVTFAASASDLVDGDTPVTCDPASGSTFALGDTEVTCSSTDAHSNTGDRSFKVTVQDSTAPTLHMPGNVTVPATSAQGAAVSYAATASDLVDGAVAPTCSQPSGTVFPLGSTTVTCIAKDAHGNTASGSFDVTVSVPWNGVLQPINNDGSSVFKQGSTVPVKFLGFAGLTPTLRVALVSGAIEGTSVEAISTAAADTGNQFRYDASAGQYIFNLNTKSLAGGTYKLHINLGDGTDRVVTISLKK
ncbi:MAG: HYR domain-containing protein [Marmoricola sp.]